MPLKRVDGWLHTPDHAGPTPVNSVHCPRLCTKHRNNNVAPESGHSQDRPVCGVGQTRIGAEEGGGGGGGFGRGGGGGGLKGGGDLIKKTDKCKPEVMHSTVRHKCIFILHAKPG